jgi:glucosamine--fructose-6-phosphate aminotransferase (isomerizing)
MSGGGISAMARETAETPAVAARLVARRAEFHALAAGIDLDRARVAVICGRGSSGHAGIHLRYLIETRLGLPVSQTAPSILTAYDRPLRLDGALFIVISQSGASPDMVAATQAARAVGAQTLAIVNVADSPVAAAAERVVALGAAPELAVAATKSVVGSMAAGAELVAALAGDEALHRALDRLPERLGRAAALDWSALATLLQDAACSYVCARGFGLGTAREIALKVAETICKPALAYSAAELRHGPRAAVTARTPALVLRLADATAGTVDAIASDLSAGGVPVLLAGGPGSALPWIGDDHAATDAIAMLAPAYRAIEAAARRLGFDPDHPPYLSKVTKTF